MLQYQQMETLTYIRQATFLAESDVAQPAGYVGRLVSPTISTLIIR